MKIVDFNKIHTSERSSKVFEKAEKTFLPTKRLRAFYLEMKMLTQKQKLFAKSLFSKFLDGHTIELNGEEYVFSEGCELCRVMK